MTTIEISCCDQCSKEVKDRYLEYGWVRIIGRSELTFAISIRRGDPERPNDNDPKTAGQTYRELNLDFCSIEHFKEFLIDLFNDQLTKMNLPPYSSPSDDSSPSDG